MAEMTMNETSKYLGVPHTVLSGYFKRNLLTGRRSGGVILMNPTVIKRELKELGYTPRNAHKKILRNQGKSTCSVS